MKFWRTMAVVALAVAFSTAAFAGAIAHKNCVKNTESAPVFPLVMCVEMQDHTSDYIGNGFPWENDTGYFATFRNQYLYPEKTVNDVANVSATVESIHMRSVSFTGAATNIYGTFRNGRPSELIVTDNLGPSLVPTFAANAFGPNLCYLSGTAANPITIGNTTGPNGTLLSSCTSCVDNHWCDLGTVTPGVRTFTHVLFDQIMSIAGGSGYAVWDMTWDNCMEPSRAYGSGSFVNSNHMTTAYGIDTAGFIWVFHGVGLPPPATVEQQIKEIVRLLLTPQGLRCSGLDLHAGNGMIEDDPISFPNGKYVDPIQPQVTNTRADIMTGDETKDGLRKTGWMP